MTEQNTFTRVRHTEAPPPNSCRWCGREEQNHGMTFARSVGNHYYAAPTDKQRLARMLSRKNTQ